MNGLVEIVLTASLVSGAAALCLALVPHAPPRLRFRIALAGLAAWAVPWPLVTLPIEVPMPAAIARPAASASDAAALDGTVMATAEAAEQTGTASARAMHRLQVAAVVALLFLPGLVCFVRDATALRASLRTWRRSSRSGAALRAHVPAELRDVRASIRIVPDSAIAATSGWLRSVVWLGDRLSPEDRGVALVHELSHVASRDPLWITFVTLIRRAYWWNPVVAWLGREAVLAMEAACDRRCAGWIGRERYVERLASMMLDAVAPPAPRLLAYARTPNLNVRRLRLLEAATPRFRPRDGLSIALTAALAGAAATYAVAKPAPVSEHDAAASESRPAWSRVVIPDTPAGNALEALLDAFNAGDSERLAIELGAFTPQEIEFDVPRSSGGLELVAIVVNDPMRIEYVAEDRVGRIRRRGELEVAEWDTNRIARLDVRQARSGRDEAR